MTQRVKLFIRKTRPLYVSSDTGDGQHGVLHTRRRSVVASRGRVHHRGRRPLQRPFVLWALAYKTYIYAETGHWYAWGAPTQIGVCNRIISYALVVLGVIGITFLGAGHVMALVRRRRAAAPRSHSPIIGAIRR